MVSKDSFLKNLEAIIEESLTNEDLDNQYLAQELAISERQLYRKIKEIVNQSPNQFIRSYRLKKAMELIESQQYTTVQEIAMSVGYQNVHYFSKIFLAAHGETPMEVLKRLNLR